jgi:hypothetical protein
MARAFDMEVLGRFRAWRAESRGERVHAWWIGQASIALAAAATGRTDEKPHRPEGTGAALAVVDR